MLDDAGAKCEVYIILYTGCSRDNARRQRQEICNGLEFLGAVIDKKVNEEMAGQDGIISTPESTVKILSVTTDEEYVIAKDTYELSK